MVIKSRNPTKEEIDVAYSRFKDLIVLFRRIKVESVLDLGCEYKFMRAFLKPKKYIGVDIIDNADIVLDLNKTKKLPFPKDSFDLVIASHLLEHLFYPLKMVEEMKRVSKKYVLIGLPNQYTYDNRISFLFGGDLQGFYRGYGEFGHHHLFGVKSIETFVKKNFGGWRIVGKKHLFTCKGARYLPRKIRNFLANIYPPLFSKQIYYLMQK